MTPLYPHHHHPPPPPSPPPGYNGIDETGGKVLLEAVEANTALKEIHVKGNHMNEGTKKKIKAAGW